MTDEVPFREHLEKGLESISLPQVHTSAILLLLIGITTSCHPALMGVRQAVGKPGDLLAGSTQIPVSPFNPFALLTHGLTDDATPTRTKSWSWGCDGTACTYRYVIDQQANIVPSGSWGAISTANLAAGTGLYYIHVQARDESGNISAVSTASAILDNTPPVVSAVTVSSALTVDVVFSESMGGGATTAANFTVTGSGIGTLSDHPNSVTSLGGLGYRLTWASGLMLNGGNITVTVAGALDLAGNVTASSGTAAGGAVAVLPSVTGLSDDLIAKSSKTWSWGCSAPSCTFRYTIDTTATTAPGGVYGAPSSASRSTGSATYFIHVQAKDAAGNVSSVVHVATALWQPNLLSGLVAHVGMDEANGTRADDSGNSINFNFNASWGSDESAVGKVGTAANWDAGQYLERPYGDTAFDVTSGEITFQFWYWADADYSGTFGTPLWLDYRYRLSHVTSRGWENGLAFTVSTAYNDPAGDISTAGWTPPLFSTWYHIICYIDRVRGKIGMQVDNGTPLEADITASVATPLWPYGMKLGFCGSTSNCYPIRGRLDEFAFWNRKLTAEEITSLYNTGAAKVFGTW